jgi:hypothetical protein
MINMELVRQLQGFGKDADKVLIEFPKEGGPYRSPGDLVPLIGTNDVIIETVYPRNDTIVRDFFDKLMEYPAEGNVQLFINQGGSHPVGYYTIGGIRIHERGIVLIAGEVIAT